MDRLPLVIAVGVGWAVVTIVGLNIAEDLPTPVNVVLFYLLAVAVGIFLNRWIAVAIPYVVALLLICAAIVDSCAYREEVCVDGTSAVVALVMLAPIPATGIAIGVLIRRVQARLAFGDRAS